METYYSLRNNHNDKTENIKIIGLCTSKYDMKLYLYTGKKNNKKAKYLHYSSL